MPVSKEALDDWLAHPVTREFAKRLARSRQDIMESWAGGAFLEDSEFKTAINGAVAISQCKLLATLLDLQPEDFDES